MARKWTQEKFPRPPEYADDAPQPFWPTFAEKLILALIDAYPQSALSGRQRAESSERQGRLEDALHTLFGIPRPKGKKITYKLHALMAAAMDACADSMAQFEKVVLKWPKEKVTKSRSRRAASQKLGALVKGNSLESSAELLRKCERNARTYVTQISLFNHHQEEEDMEQDLQEIARILAKWNINLHIDPEALGMASLWGQKRGI